ncbi:DsbA family protein [Asticcacaulis sp. BYS171W]|uniref:DsbA family protein n=1 Tax=Asticcacaulis aquaticus TaxID=2984212 RepID=A0ABT5HTC1_9CAUL|nr:DsbA family protein [Asticcacaulis aquaticus]MDC7683306.1 DsbA family protein [Asticcacaulis aquaticus]
MITRRHMLALGAATAAVPFSAAAQTDFPTLAEVTVDPDAPFIGNANGDLTIVEYFDYQCSVCKHAHFSLMDIVRADGNIRWMLRDWIIFGEVSTYAAQVALGAQTLGVYEQVSSALMRIPGGNLNKGDIFGALMQTGLTPADLLKAYRADQARIDALLARNARQAEGFGFSGTPSFIIGNAVYRGALSPDDMTQAIADARQRQKALSA